MLISSLFSCVSFLAGFRVFSRPAQPPRQALRPWVCPSVRRSAPARPTARPPRLCPSPLTPPRICPEPPRVGGDPVRSCQSVPPDLRRVSGCRNQRASLGPYPVGVLGIWAVSGPPRACLCVCVSVRSAACSRPAPRAKCPGCPFGGRRARAAASATWEPAGDPPGGRRRSTRSAPAPC